MKSRKRALQIVSVFFIFGGFVRLFANRKIFELFQMQELWVEHAYFIYIYRVLGSFVILTGLILFAISRNLNKYFPFYHVLTIGFVFIGLVMMVTGILCELSVVFYFPDFMFCFLVAWFIFRMRVRVEQRDQEQNITP